MEIFVAGLDIIENIIYLIGGGMIIVGLVHLFQGYGDNNAAQKQVGIALFVSGVGVAAVGFTLVPMLANII